MTYTKPADLKYTEIAIWIDEHAYDEDCNEVVLYEYLYHLSIMLANKYKYFTKLYYYDQFGLFSASRLFMRLRTNADRLPQIKSILNYIKKVIYPYKVDFEQENYLDSDKDIPVMYMDSNVLSMHLSENIDIFDKIDFTTSLDNLIQMIQNYLSKIPYKKDSPEWYNIYISCILTLLDQMNITADDIETFHKDYSKQLINLDRIYKHNKERTPKLYHLDQSMNGYIKVLVNELKHLIADNLTNFSDNYQSAEVSMKNLILASLESDYD